MHHAAIEVADLARATRFYTDVVGLHPHPRRPHWLAGAGACELHLIEVPDARTAGRPPTRAHIAFVTPSLEEMRDRLLDAGCEPWQNGFDWSARAITGPEQSLDWGIGTIFVSDPDGHVLEFVEIGRGIIAVEGGD